MSEHDLPIEFRNDRGELVDPADDVVYSGSYTPLPDSPPTFNPSGTHSCTFCASSDWAWILEILPASPAAALAWAPFLVACNSCFQLYQEDVAGLRQRIMNEDNPCGMLEHLDELLPRIVSVAADRHVAP